MVPCRPDCVSSGAAIIGWSSYVTSVVNAAMAQSVVSIDKKVRKKQDPNGGCQSVGPNVISECRFVSGHSVSKQH